jgi:hypothetical protein
LAVPAWAQLPARDFVVELREVTEPDGTGTAVRTETEQGRLVAQRVSVRNGEKATLRFNLALPLQWVQKLETQSSSPAAAGGTTGSGITQGLVWMDAGQSVVVTPRWAGARQPVVVEIDVQKAAVNARTGAELPDQWKSQMATTVSAALGEWVTVATEGPTWKAGVYSSSAASHAPRTIELRVTLR